MFEFDIEEIKDKLEGMSFTETLDALDRLDDDLELAISDVFQLKEECIDEYTKSVYDMVSASISVILDNQKWDKFISVENYVITINSESSKLKIYIHWFDDDIWRIYVEPIDINADFTKQVKMLSDFAEKQNLFFIDGLSKVCIKVEKSKLQETLLKIIFRLCDEEDYVGLTDLMINQFTNKVKNSSKDASDDERDPLFYDAARCFVIAKKARLAALQRLFDISLKRASHIMDQLEAAGIIGPVSRICDGSCIDNATPREVLIDEATLDKIQNSN